MGIVEETGLPRCNDEGKFFNWNYSQKREDQCFLVFFHGYVDKTVNIEYNGNIWLKYSMFSIR